MNNMHDACVSEVILKGLWNPNQKEAKTGKPEKKTLDLQAEHVF